MEFDEDLSLRLLEYVERALAEIPDGTFTSSVWAMKPGGPCYLCGSSGMAAT